MTRTAMALTAVVVLGGCWLQPGGDARRSGFAPLADGLDIRNVAQLQEKWAHPLSGTVTAPVVGLDGVYAVSGDNLVGGKLTLVDPGTGTTRWDATLWDANIPYWPHPPTVLDGKVHVPMLGASPALSSAVRRFDAPTGAPLPSLANGGASTVIGRDGTLVGTVALQVPLGSTAFSRFFVESTNGGGGWVSYLYFGDLASLPVPTSAAVGTGRFFIGRGAALEAYPLTKPGNCVNQPGVDFCPPIWSVPLTSSVAGNPVLSEDEATVYAAAGSKLLVRNAADGTSRWTGTLGAPASAAPALANGYVFVPTTTGELDVFTTGCGTATCTPIWTAATGSTITQPPAVKTGGLVFLASSNHTLAAFNALGCAPNPSPCAALWSKDVGAAITGGPVLAAGKVFVGTDDGRLIAYGI